MSRHVRKIHPTGHRRARYRRVRLPILPEFVGDDERLEWLRLRIDELRAEGARLGISGWVFVSAVRGWVRDREHELNK